MYFNDGESSNNAAILNELDPNLWHKLPHELLERVHMCLPLISLARFRSVYTAWNKIVFDEGFIRVREELVAQKPWIVITSTANSMSIFDTEAGGLLCFSNAWFQWPGMAVINPATNKWRRLPPLSTWMITTVGMVYNDATHTYKILVCGRLEDHSMITEVFDSATGRWVPGGIPSAAKKYGDETLAWRDGIFYCLTFPFSTLSLMAYDLARATWHEVPVAMPMPIISPSVAVCNRRLLLVGGMEEQENSVFYIQIWELDFDTFVWEELEKMPAQLCKDFGNNMVPNKPISCFGTGDYLFFTVPCTRAYLPALVYDLKQKTWNWWPAQGFPPQLPGMNIGRQSGISFVPRLHARV